MNKYHVAHAAARTMELREADIERQIMDYLAWRRIPAVQTHGLHYLPGGGVRVIRPFRKGMPDIICSLPPTGRTCFIEVKDDEGIVTKEQESVMREFYAAGALVLVARSVQDVADAIGRKQCERLNSER
jgi:hypothetical protein